MDPKAAAHADPTALLRESLPTLVAVAARAPSPLNTQPWRFRWRDDGIDVLADRGRTLHVADPDGRQLTIACGAALFNLRLGIRHLGVDPLLTAFPDPHDKDLLARVTAAGIRLPEPAEVELLAAVPYRHTHRGPFTVGEVEPEVLVALQDAAREEGAALRLVEHPGVKSSLAGVVASADRAQQEDPRVQAEIRTWTPAPGSHRRDGVPATAYPRPGATADHPFPARDHALGREQGIAVDGPGYEPEIAVLTTDGDSRTDWLTAGQALERVLLAAARRWVFASFLGQLMEIGHLRPVVREELGLEGVPQVVLRMGRASVAASTPRREVSDVLELAAHGDPVPGEPVPDEPVPDD